MSFDHQHYVPCLRWKMGEYQAVLRLSESTMSAMTPLIEVPEIGFDFAKQQPSKSVDDHVAPFAKRVKEKWGMRPCFVDLRLLGSSARMIDGTHPNRFIFEELRTHGCIVTPVAGIDRDSQYLDEVKRAVSKDGRGLCMRIRLEEAGRTDLKSSVDGVLSRLGLEARDCDLVLDLEAPPNFEPVYGFAKLIETMTRRLPYLRRWRTFTVIGTSFPVSMGEIEKGATSIPRSEWLLYKTLIENLAKSRVRLPAFGDYVINHPDILPMDMRLLKPSATIRYAADDSWFVVKGTSVRNDGFEQYREHCQTVLASPHYSGPGFSWGDKYIENCASHGASTGNLTTWRGVGTNHHLEKVVRDISSLHGSSGNP